MRYLAKILSTLLLAHIWLFAHADVKQYYVSNPDTSKPNLGPFFTIDSACSSWFSALQSYVDAWTWTALPYSEAAKACQAKNDGGGGAYGFISSKIEACPKSYIEENGQCVDEMSSEKACGAAFYNSNAYGNTSLPVVLDGQVSSGSYCQPQGDSIKPGLACAMNFSLDMSWRTDDGNWHSRGTLQPKMIGSNFQPCVPGLDDTNAPPDPSNPPDLPKKQESSCPNGYAGQVGGETKCIPSFGYNGVDFAPKTKSSETATTKTDTTTKTECASGKCTTTETIKVTDKATGQSTTTENVSTEVDRDWCSKLENKDKCAANGKPPYSGQGTNSSGGGSGNGNGDGEGDGEEKGGRCGAKGQPPCKIDETGTPTGEGKFDPALDKQAQDHQHRMDTLGGIKSTADKDTSMGFSGFAWLTHKACSPWNLGDLKILTETFKIELNICVIEPYVIPVMNFLWILATIFMTFSRVASVMGAKVD